MAIDSARRAVKLERFPDLLFSVPSVLSLVLSHGEREGVLTGEPGSGKSSDMLGGALLLGNAELS